MPASGVSGYAAINARVRVMYAALLAPQEYARLAAAADLPALVAQLKHGPYGPYLAVIKDQEMSPERAIRAIKTRLADDFQSVIHTTPGDGRALLAQLYRSYEVGNLKAVLRGLVAGSSWERVEAVLFPLGAMTLLRPQAMVEAGSVSAAVDLLRGTAYEETLAFAMKRYSAEQNLFALEVALDLNYWRKLWQEARVLRGQDRDQALRVIGSLVDMNNLMWAIRYRVYHQLSEEELINYTLPFGFHVHDEDVRSIAAGADIPSVVARVYPALSGVNALLEDPKTGLPQLELKLKQQLMQQCVTAFIGNPFHIGIPLAYLVLSDLELQDLTVLIEAKSRSLPESEFRPYLVRPALA